MDPDVVSCPSDYPLLCYIARLINEGFYTNGRSIRRIPVVIGGSSYVPPIPEESEVKMEIENILQSKEENIEKAIELTLYCMKRQIFVGGNKRAAILFANHFMIRHGLGLLVVPEHEVSEFKKHLVTYYEGKEEDTIKKFLKEKCWRQF